MSEFIRAIQTSDSKTENNCVTHSTSSSACVDLFFQIGASRFMPDSDVKQLFDKAFSENPSNALKILFYARDIRGGQGERKTFRTLMNHASKSYTSSVESLVCKIPDYGRWDDIFCVFDTPLEKAALDLIEKNLRISDSTTINESALCAKWMPREKSSKRHNALKIRRHMKLSSKEYRKLLSSRTSVVETKMCFKQWSDINYPSVPSVAMKNYTSAFAKNDESRFESFVEDVSCGKSKVNAKALYPHDLIERVMLSVKNNVEALSYEKLSPEFAMIQEQWNSLPNYLMDNPERILPVVDTSGSMYSGGAKGPSPICVSIALGMYIAERNNGPFKDHFVTFSESPSLEKLYGNTIFHKAANLASCNWGYNTDLQKVFSIILSKARDGCVPDYEMPSVILILSDMQFDQACDESHTALESIKDKYSELGYTLPKIVFWNLNASANNCPVKFDESGTALVSGFSPSIMKTLLSSSEFSPEKIMNDTINSERYSAINI